jgi:tagatose-1,6-bisphosphate aldolase
MGKSLLAALLNTLLQGLECVSLSFHRIYHQPILVSALLSTFNFMPTFDLSPFQVQGKMPMMAIDHQDSFQKLLRPESLEQADRFEIQELKQQIMEAALSYCSGVLLDIETALPAYQQLQQQGIRLPPYFLTFTTTSYSEVKAGERVTTLAYHAKKLKDHGAQGTKLFLSVHPHAETFADQIAVAKQAQEESRAVGLPFLLEPIIYERSKGEDKTALLFEAISALKQAGVDPEVWKVEYPGNAEACDHLHTLVSPTPWILLSRGIAFDAFAQNMKGAADHGAVGFFVGRALWQEAVERTGEERAFFLKQIIPARMKILREAIKLSS